METIKSFYSANLILHKSVIETLSVSSNWQIPGKAQNLVLNVAHDLIYIAIEAAYTYPVKVVKTK